MQGRDSALIASIAVKEQQSNPYEPTSSKINAKTKLTASDTSNPTLPSRSSSPSTQMHVHQPSPSPPPLKTEDVLSSLGSKIGALESAKKKTCYSTISNMKDEAESEEQSAMQFTQMLRDICEQERYGAI